jgi:hypothetical protein
MEDVHYGEVGPNHLLDCVVNYCHSWCPSGLHESCCQDITVSGLNWLESPQYPQIWGTLACCSHSVVILIS